MSKLFIIGNGFDLDLGLQTKYNDFIKSEYFPTCKNLRQDSLIVYIKTKYQIQKWIDLECEIKNFATRKHNMSSAAIDRTREEFEILVKGLRKYFDTLNLEINADSVAARLLKRISLDPDFEIISFNYTPLLTIARTQLNISSDLNFKYLYGSIMENSIILGVNDDPEIRDELHFLIKAHNPNYQSFYIRDALDKANEIIIFGLSLGAIDYIYFKEFFQKQSERSTILPQRKKISIFTYDEKSREEILLHLRNMNQRSVDYLYGNNDLKFFRTALDEDKKKIDDFILDLNVDPKVHISFIKPKNPSRSY